MGYSVTRSRPCLSEGSSHHGADSVHLVPGDRPQPAEIRSQYLPGNSLRLRPGDPAHLLLTGDAVASCAAGHAVKAAQNSCENEETSDARDFQLVMLSSVMLGEVRRQPNGVEAPMSAGSTYGLWRHFHHGLAAPYGLCRCGILKDLRRCTFSPYGPCQK